MDLFAQKSEQLRCLHILEKHRVESFKENWAHGENDPCSVANMAEAGFYFTGNQHGDDSVTCFLCGKSLDGWLKTDDPWLEHQKHAPQCLFSKFGRKEGDLTVEEFLEIYGVVMNNKIKANLVKEKKVLREAASVELDNFLRKK